MAESGWYQPKARMPTAVNTWMAFKYLLFLNRSQVFCYSVILTKMLLFVFSSYVIFTAPSWSIYGVMTSWKLTNEICANCNVQKRTPPHKENDQWTLGTKSLGQRATDQSKWLFFCSTLLSHFVYFERLLWIKLCFHQKNDKIATSNTLVISNLLLCPLIWTTTYTCMLKSQPSSKTDHYTPPPLLFWLLLLAVSNAACSCSIL